MPLLILVWTRTQVSAAATLVPHLSPLRCPVDCQGENKNLLFLFGLVEFKGGSLPPKKWAESMFLLVDSLSMFFIFLTIVLFNNRSFSQGSLPQRQTVEQRGATPWATGATGPKATGHRPSLRAGQVPAPATGPRQLSAWLARV